LHSFVAPQMQLVIIAPRNRTKSFNKLLAGKVPADGKVGSQQSKVRRRFGTGFMIGLEGLNVPAQPNSEDYPKKCFAMGPPLEPSKNNKIFRPTAISNGIICNSSKERENDHGPAREQ
jgi:hypothetical protein